MIVHVRPLHHQDGGGAVRADGQEGETVTLRGVEDPREHHAQEGNIHEEVGGEQEELQADADGDSRDVQGDPHGAGEAPAVRGCPDPGQPTKDERMQHDLTHLPFRPWCRHCVEGRAPDEPHRAQPPQVESEVPKISVDYGFVAHEGESEQRTVLVLKAAPSKIVVSKVVKGKGREDPDAVPWIMEQLRRLGVGRCVMQADGEPAQRAFIP